MVEDTDGPRRAVHAARYADTMPPEERGPFWDAAVEKYLTTELALMNGADR